MPAVRSILKTLVCVLALMSLGLSASAHDYWLLPEKFNPAPGEAVNVRLYFGDNFEKPEDERPFQKDRTPGLVLVSSGETRDFAATTPDQQKPLLKVDFPRPGSYLLALDRNAQTIDLKAEDFNEYLEHEGLGDILELRKQSNQLKNPGRERYSRNIKAVMQVGTPVDEVPLRVLGRTLELVPQQNPYALKPGADLTVQVLFEGAALAGREVAAYNLTAGKLTQQQARTDKDGRVTFQVQPGQWMVRLVHMRACQKDCAGVDWESYWSSLTFAL